MYNTKIDEKKIDRLANLAVNTGLSLKPGQDLLITSPVEALPLVRRIVVHAYKAGANLVTPLFSEPEITLARYENAPDTSLDKAASWLYNGMGEADNNTARLAIVGDDPMLLEHQDPGKLEDLIKLYQTFQTSRERITTFTINWNIVAWPGKAWACRVFPELSAEELKIFS